jgi:hypothetical protein
VLGDFELRFEVLLIEQPEFKRRWTYRDWPAEVAAATDTLALELLERYVSERVEVFTGAQIVRYAVRGSWGGETVVGPDGEPGLLRLIGSEAVPYLAVLRYTDTGLDKHAVWEQTWDFQRSADVGKHVEEIPAAPKYDPKDYHDATIWQLRGKLDVPI